MPYRRLPWTARPPSSSPAPTRSPPSARSARLTRRFATEALGRAGELVAGWMDEAGWRSAATRPATCWAVSASGRGRRSSSVAPRHGPRRRPLRQAARRPRRDRGRRARRLAGSRRRWRSRRSPTRRWRFHVPRLGRLRGSLRAGVASSWTTRVTVAEAVRCGGRRPGRARRRPSPVLAGYLEAHIEQGPVLEAEDLPVGVVSAIAGQTRAQVTLEGRAAHAGTTPMRARRDALAAASEIVLAVEQCALDAEGLVATVGVLDVEPGATRRPRPGAALGRRPPRPRRLGRGVAAIAARRRDRSGSRRRARGSRGGRCRRSRWPRRCASGSPRRSRHSATRFARCRAARARRRRALPRLPAAMLFVRCAGGSATTRASRSPRATSRSPSTCSSRWPPRLTLGEHRRPQWEMMGALIGSTSTGEG